jgi:hypothetical protein
MNVSKIIKKIVFYLEKLTGKIIHQEDIANLFGIDKKYFGYTKS